MTKPKWFQGQPASIAPGMLLRTARQGLILVGNSNEWGNLHGNSDSPIDVIEWAWIIKPHELEWLGGKEAQA
jgi:hypothetical protein